jgi:ribosomal protein S11
MTISFSQLIATTTEAAMQSLMQTCGEIVGLDFEGMSPNAVVRAIGRSVVPKVLVDAFEIVAEMARGGFLDFAPDGPWLEAKGEQDFGVERIRQTFATTVCTFTNASEENTYSFTSGQVIVKNPTTGKTYKAAAFSLAAAGDEGDEVEGVAITAVDPGRDSDANIGDINQMATTFDGVTVTNTAPARATDLEPRAAYIARCRLAAAAISPGGARDAYRYVALSAKDDEGVSYGITKVQVVADDIAGDVQVYLADPDGVLGAGVADAIDDLLLAVVVPHGINWLGASAATPVTIDIEYTAIGLEAVGLEIADIEALVEAALDDLFNDAELNPIGGVNNDGASGFMYHSKIRATIAQVQAEPGAPRPLFEVQVPDPSGNTVIANGEIAVRGTITHGITLV